MNDDFPLPVTAHPFYVGLVFSVAAVVFHILFVRTLKLDKIAWKRVDYIWLGVGTLGLFGAATEVRRMVATSVLETRNADQRNRYSELRDRVRSMTGSYCRAAAGFPLVLDDWFGVEHHSEDERRQYKAVCEFGKDLLKALPSEAPTTLSDEPFRGFRGLPFGLTDGTLRATIDGVNESLLAYRSAERAVARVTVARERTPAEIAVTVPAPFLLALALALRITKVSGEIRLEQGGV
jgi:hypothetical protein